ncbi:MAG: GGDEF domain-containing protein [Firmicutes bacterium]|nr:GGDEF domain-containing protein [Bacillota bacterium]
MAREMLTIAFFTTDVEEGFSNRLCQGVVEAAEDKNVNLLIFPGKALGAPLYFQYQYNVIYNLIDKNVDGLIISSSLMHRIVDFKKAQEFYARYSPLPIVVIGEGVDGTTGVLVDNHIGIVDGIRHLVNVHGRKRIAFIQGNMNSHDGKQRYEAYRDGLKENNLAFDQNIVVPGDFSADSGERAIAILVDERHEDFDAIVASNDEMALTAIEGLKKRGYNIPADISVIGFDNIYESDFSDPTLTTVVQPIYEMGYAAVDLLLRRIKGESPSNVIFPPILIARESCGCNKVENNVAKKRNEAMVDINREILSTKSIVDGKYKLTELIYEAVNNKTCNLQRILTDFKKIVAVEKLSGEACLALQRSFIRISKLLRKQMANERDKDVLNFFSDVIAFLIDRVHQAYSQNYTQCVDTSRHLRTVLDIMVANIGSDPVSIESVREELIELGIQPWYIYLYEKEILQSQNSIWSFPEYSILASGRDEERTLKPGTQIRTKEIIDLEKLKLNKRHTLIVYPLFFQGHQMGIGLCNFNFQNAWMYEHLFLEISCVLKMFKVFKEKEDVQKRLQDAMFELQQRNIQLNDMTQTDELTGLLNRRGFMIAASHSLDLAYQMGKVVHFFFVDLDGLKYINDTYGHEEGDYAIRQTGEILKKAFRGMDVVARLGGDEFTVLTIGTSRGLEELFRKRLDYYVELYNKGSNKPYKLSLSIGCIESTNEEALTLEDLMVAADRRLYEEKAGKRIGV